MEGISMLQSLIDAQNTKPIYVYLLHGPSEQEPLLLSAAASATKAYFVQLMNESLHCQQLLLNSELTYDTIVVP
eukprot:scaffold486_cov79-Cylindrotheca_fusiformis.AAC.5